MTNQSRVLLSLAAAAALSLVCGSHGQAQSAGGGSVQSPEQPRTNNNPVPPVGPQQSNMPLANDEQFTNPERQAPHSAPTGTPGVSK
jgi:hypothetical protein